MHLKYLWKYVHFGNSVSKWFFYNYILYQIWKVLLSFFLLIIYFKVYCVCVCVCVKKYRNTISIYKKKNW